MGVEELAQKFLNDSKRLTEEQYRSSPAELPSNAKLVFRNQRKKAQFAPENQIDGSNRVHVSPSGKYKLEIVHFKTETGWQYSQGTVTEVSSGRDLALVQRNYDAFPFAWVEGHANGNDYLVCGEDYQGQTVIELNTGNRVDYVSKAAEKGMGFCWASIHPNADGSLLLVEGCYWGCPWEVVIYDFSQPMSHPLLELSRPENCTEFVTWEDTNEAKIRQSYDARKSDHKPESELTDDEIRDLLRQEHAGVARDLLWETVEKVETWKRPTFYQALHTLTESFITWRRRNGLKISRAVMATAEQLVQRCSTEEKQRIEREIGADLSWAKENLDDEE